jgi:hypothetical protein
VWQRAFVILDPCVFPRIDPAVARLASEIMSGLTEASLVGAFAEYRPARSRFIDRHDRRHLAVPLKKVKAPEFPEARSARREVHSPAAISIHILANIAAVKLRPSHKHDNQPNSDQDVYASNRHAETKIGPDALRLELGMLAAHCIFPTRLSHPQ